MSTTIQTATTTELATLPATFRETALASPDQIRQALATVDTATEASGVLDKTDTMATYARRVRADTETINALQFAKLLIIAKLAELMPRAKGGRGKTRAGRAPRE